MDQSWIGGQGVNSVMMAAASGHGHNPCTEVLAWRIDEGWCIKSYIGTDFRLLLQDRLLTLSS